MPSTARFRSCGPQQRLAVLLLLVVGVCLLACAAGAAGAARRTSRTTTGSNNQKYNHQQSASSANKARASPPPPRSGRSPPPGAQKNTASNRARAGAGRGGGSANSLVRKLQGHLQNSHQLFDLSAFNVRAAFDMHDYNDDGYIDRDEARTLWEDEVMTDKQIEQEIDMTLRVLDEDRDGRMSFPEFSRFYERATENKPFFPELT